MTEEIKNLEEVKEENKCFCKSTEFKNFIIIALGSFVGVFLALCLFVTLNRPPMPPAPIGHGPMHHFERPMHHHFHGEPKCHEFHKMHKHLGPESERRIEHREMDRVHPPQPVQ